MGSALGFLPSLALPDDAFDPWVQREMYGKGWTVYGLLAFGEPIPDALARCPHTATVLTWLNRRNP